MVVCLVDAARSPSRMALLGIAPRLGEIATDDVPSVADFDLLGLELGELAGLSCRLADQQAAGIGDMVRRPPELAVGVCRPHWKLGFAQVSR
jgi:hypothetical protein